MHNNKINKVKPQESQVDAVHKAATEWYYDCRLGRANLRWIPPSVYATVSRSRQFYLDRHSSFR